VVIPSRTRGHQGRLLDALRAATFRPTAPHHHHCDHLRSEFTTGVFCRVLPLFLRGIARLRTAQFAQGRRWSTPRYTTARLERGDESRQTNELSTWVSSPGWLRPPAASGGGRRQHLHRPPNGALPPAPHHRLLLYCAVRLLSAWTAGSTTSR
jgi:hypothetical protein